jgi:hypothetical protein
VAIEVPSFDLSPKQLAHIGEVGAALFEGRKLQASENGLISVRPTSDATSEKGNTHESGQEAGSATGSWERRQGSRRRRSPDPNTPERTRKQLSLRLGHLRKHYSDVRTWDGDTNGRWLSISSFPIGQDGPRATFLIAVPTDPQVRISAWGFWRFHQETTWIGHRHTNYPDGTVCAFPIDRTYWREEDTLLPYVDLLSEWSFRHIYYALKGLWPGPQEGPCPYYRMRETRLGECCPRCKGLKRYEQCCRTLDEAEARPDDRENFIATMGCDVGQQRPHRRLFDLASGNRERPPRMAYVHAGLRKKHGNPWAWDD